MSLAPNTAQRHFEHKVGAHVYPVLPGDHLVIQEPEVALTTLLGSCVAACIRDTKTGIGGLNHFLLPGTDQSQSTRYGAFAMEVLINGILSAGGNRSTLEAKVFGGGEVIASTAATPVGTKNATFVKTYLQGEGIKILAQDLGGAMARRVFFFPETGVVRVQYLNPIEARGTVEGEERLAKSLTQKPQTGTVELFG